MNTFFAERRNDVVIFLRQVMQVLSKKYKPSIELQPGSNLIDPKEVIRRYSVEELCEAADSYYKSISDPRPQMGKPFSSISEAPEMLIGMGQLLLDLQLGKTMRVLEFGAGTCWFSRFLNQMQCSTISCDTSAAALEVGRRLFREHPIIGEYVAEPQFLVFNGRTIDLPDSSVDRIICFDTFHHIPNQHDVLAEFSRILKDDGIAGFSEPGRYHSQSPQSQYEMANFKVLENDVDLDSIFSIAKSLGFTRCHATVRTIAKSIFFLHKGHVSRDSRSHVGLACSIRAERLIYSIRPHEPLNIMVDILNSGGAKWLNRNVGDIGVVKLGAHLYDVNDNLLNLDFARSSLQEDVSPGESVSTTLTISFNEPGEFFLSLDMVSESICWFENVGSTPVRIKVIVE